MDKKDTFNKSKMEHFENGCLMDNDIMGIGRIPSKDGYNRVRINIDYLQDALDMLKGYKFEDNAVVIFVKDNGIIQIGKENIGVIIAPVVDDEVDKLRGCDDNE